jgi:hypothetical protein
MRLHGTIRIRFWQLLLLAAMSASAANAWAQATTSEEGLQDTPENTADQQTGYRTSVNEPAPAIPSDATSLDHVVAVINGDVLLQSDVLEEERFAQFEPFEVRGSGNEAQQALNHLINRTLILQQLKELQTIPDITDAEVRAQIAELRKHIPECAANKCTSVEGWKGALAAQGFTEAVFEQRWRVRMLVLSFIEQRFRAGIRISKPEVQDYYEKNLVPQFRKRNVAAPSLATVSQRIDEVLLQQRVNGLLSEWLDSLKDQGTVAILDPEYKQIASKENADDNGGNVEGAQE